MNIFNSNYLNNSLSIPSWKTIRCFFNQMVYRIRTIWDLQERNEYQAFRDLKFCAKQLSVDELNSVDSFLEAWVRVDTLFQESMILTHTARLNSGSRASYEDFLKKDGIEKVVTKVHEYSEMLSLKWEYGRDFSDPGFEFFFPAHEMAIEIENRYYLAVATQAKLPLTLRALNYVRFCDELYLSASTILYSYKDRNLRHETFLKNQNEIPNAEEIEDLVAFTKQTQSHKSFEASTIREMLYHRFLFTSLKEDLQSEEKERLLLLLLAYCARFSHYENVSIHKLTEALRSVISDPQVQTDFDAEELIQDIWNKQTDHFPVLFRNYTESLENFF